MEAVFYADRGRLSSRDGNKLQEGEVGGFLPTKAEYLQKVGRSGLLVERITVATLSHPLSMLISFWSLEDVKNSLRTTLRCVMPRTVVSITLRGDRAYGRGGEEITSPSSLPVQCVIIFMGWSCAGLHDLFCCLAVSSVPFLNHVNLLFLAENNYTFPVSDFGIVITTTRLEECALERKLGR